ALVIRRKGRYNLPRVRSAVLSSTQEVVTMLTHRRRDLFLAVLLLVGLGGLPTTAGAGDLDPAKLSLIPEAMQKVVGQGTVAAAVTVVGTSKGIVHHEAVGSFTLEPKKEMPKDALFRIASMTKPITAVGIMMLADEGKLSVDDPVEKHLPEFR